MYLSLYFINTLFYHVIFINYNLVLKFIMQKLKFKNMNP